MKIATAHFSAAGNHGPRFRFCALCVEVLLLLTFVGAGAAFAQTGRNLPQDALRHDHPRLFINADLLPKIRARAEGEASSYYQGLQWEVDRLLSKEIPAGDSGTDAAIVALVYVLSGRSDCLDLAKKLLESSIAFYRQCDRSHQAVNWRSNSRINAICAYDWLFNALSPQERERWGRELLEHVEAVQPGSDRKKYPGDNWSEPGDGFYGNPSLLWYVGLATWGEGIDDGRAKQFAEQGYELYQKVLALNREFAGDDGGIIATSLNYVLVAYPWADFNFLHTVKSAFGLDLSPECPHLPLLVNYILWNWLPGNRAFGAADDFHETNELPLWECYTHLAQIRHFFHKTYPNYASLAAWLQEKIVKIGYSESFPAIPLLLTGLSDSPAAKAPDDLALPPARQFETMGQFFMHSGWGEEDTYALFNAGGTVKEHKHFDENHFSIFHKGFFALDTGSRPEPGSHLYNYYCRTIAHNCVLIHMPGETMPGYWGNTIKYAPGEPPLPTPNDGGQRELTGSRVLGFETHPELTYIASDAAPAYHPDKCSLALRQFVFIPPRHFVIFDRIEAKDPSFKKTWLLHTARDIKINGHVFSTEQGEGRLMGRTLLPEDAEIKTIGGDGKQFWNGGRNWPLPLDYKINPSDPRLFNIRSELLGQWRIEVSPAGQRKSDVFLHLLEVGPKGEAVEMAPAKLIKNEKECGVEFESGPMKARLVFGLEGPASGRVKIVKGDSSFERVFTDRVQKQSGLTGAGNR